jgi:hypothetical protein
VSATTEPAPLMSSARRDRPAGVCRELAFARTAAR